MLDIPPVLPDDYPAPAALIAQCTEHASRHFRVPGSVVLAIIEVEGGRVGTVSKNSDDTYDLGIMQINTIHLPEIRKRFGVGWRELAYKPCLNIGIGTWILSQRLSEVDDFWRGVGNYHSKTPKHHNVYLTKVIKAYRKIRQRWALAQR